MKASEGQSSTLLVITGLPAVGKDTVANGIIERKEFKFQRIVTYNTRPPRIGEIHGIDYHFVSEGEFHSIRKRGEFLEYVQTGTSWKGTPKEPFEKVIKSEENFIWRIDPSRSARLDEFFLEKFGQDHGKQLYEKTVVIFLTVNDKKILEERFRNRDRQESLDEFYRRLESDMETFNKYKHKFPHIIHNDKPLKETLKEVIKIITNR
jgi:guanylate kinase